MFPRRIPQIFNTHRRNIGFVVRYPDANAQGNSRTPQNIARFIEKSARLHTEGKPVDYEACKSLIDQTLARINQFTVQEVRNIAYSINTMFPSAEKAAWHGPFAEFTIKRSHMMPVYFLYPLINSVCKMGARDPDFYRKVMAVALDRMDEANTLDLATVANTLVLLKNSGIALDPALVRSTVKRLSKTCLQPEVLAELSATNAVLIIYALAKLGVQDRPLFDALMDLIMGIEENFEPHLIPLVLHSFSVFKTRRDPRLDFLFEHIRKQMDLLSPENVSNCLVSMARIGARNDAVIRGLAGRSEHSELVARCRSELGSTGTRELANVLWALAKLKWEDPGFIDECLDRLASCQDIDAISYSQVFEALKEYRVERPELIKSLLESYAPIMRSSETRIVTQVAWCCLVLNFREHAVVRDSLDELSRRPLSAVEQKYVNLLRRYFQPG